ncbi:MAG: ATP-binding protein [Saprospiraceae bacterium]
MNQKEIILIMVIGILFILLLALGFIYFLNYSQRKIIGSQLEVKQKEIEFQQKLLTNTIETQEDERNKFAQELHDAVSSKLNIALMNLDQLQHQFQEGEDKKEVLNGVLTILRDSSETARSISHQLMPPMIKKFGLAYALEDLQSAINMAGTVHLDLQGLENLDILPEQKILHLFRIVQELVNNTIKYANANKVAIHFEKVKENLYLTYVDDGIGFDLQTIKEGIGFTNIRTRLNVLGGKIEINSKENEGMKAKITIKILEEHV